MRDSGVDLCIEQGTEQPQQHIPLFIDRRKTAEEIIREKEYQEKYRKICPSCGPVVTRYSNCARCWGPVKPEEKSKVMGPEPAAGPAFAVGAAPQEPENRSCF